jgi:hypothetical protein
MFVTTNKPNLVLEYDQSEAWLLYFLFAYIERPPTDDTFEGFEAAHDRAVDRFADPDSLVEFLIASHTDNKRSYKLAQSQAKRWRRFRERYEHKTKQEILDAISFFLRLGVIRIEAVAA